MVQQSPTSPRSPVPSPLPTHVYYSPVMDEPLALIKKPRKEAESTEEKTKSSSPSQTQVIQQSNTSFVFLLQQSDFGKDKVTAISQKPWYCHLLLCSRGSSSRLLAKVVHLLSKTENPTAQLFCQRASVQAVACLSYAIQQDSGRKCEQWREECHQQDQTDSFHLTCLSHHKSLFQQVLSSPESF